MPTIEEYTDPEKLKTMMANAKRVGNDEIWRRAFRRLCALEGLNQTDPLHRDFYETLAAYEQLLTQKNGRTTRASRTRQKLKNKGVVQCLEDWAVSKAPTEGFELLVMSIGTQMGPLIGLPIDTRDRRDDRAAEVVAKPPKDPQIRPGDWPPRPPLRV